ncbi:MAG TPA: hypothetical protein VFH70_08750, partial [Acidimicrobiales bacterium]|nr:hypothetical protein [Acidimicrobiales bacterium]
MYDTPRGQTPNSEPISFAEILSRPHRVETLAQVEAPDGTVLAWGISLAGGEVTVDSTAQFRRKCSLDLVPYGGSGIVGDDLELDAAALDSLRESLIPERAGDPTSPYGNLVRVWRGIMVPGMPSYWYGPQDDFYRWQLGLFRLSSADVQDDGVPSLRIEGYDRSRTISRNKLVDPWIVLAGTNWGDAIVALVQDRDPTAPARAHLVSEVTAGDVIVDPEQDPWEVVTEWAKAIGCEVFFDNEGYLVIREEPDLATSPIVWEYSDGTVGANAVILGVGRTMTDEPG